MPRIRLLLAALTLFAAPVLSSCSDATGFERLMPLIVAPTKAPCEGIAQQECLQVKYDAHADAWSLFYDGIEGFTWEPGYEYTLVVAVREIDTPPADGSSRSYRLVRVVRKTYIPPLPNVD